MINSVTTLASNPRGNISCYRKSNNSSISRPAGQRAVLISQKQCAAPQGASAYGHGVNGVDGMAGGLALGCRGRRPQKRARSTEAGWSLQALTVEGGACRCVRIRQDY